MPFNVSQFRNTLAFDGARPNLFEVELGGRILPGVATQKLKFTCRSAQLPGSSIGTVVVPYFGREVKFAGNRTFPEWTITIINDEDFVVRNYMEEWMNKINGHGFNFRNSSFQSPSSYVDTAVVRQFGKAGSTSTGGAGDPGKSIKVYEFIDMFPTDVSPIDLDWGSNDAMEEFTVTFQYQYWISNTTDERSARSSIR